MDKNKCTLIMDETDGGLLFNGQRNLYYKMPFEEFIKSELYQRYRVEYRDVFDIKTQTENILKEKSRRFFSLSIVIPNFLEKIDLCIRVYIKNMKVHYYTLETVRPFPEAAIMRYEDMLLFKEWIKRSLSKAPYVSKGSLDYISVIYSNWSIICKIDPRSDIPEARIRFYE